ncbi:MAG: response regulator [Gemmataceae bacterium]
MTATPSRHGTSGRPIILIVDDQAVVRDLLAALLADVGADLVFAEDGFEAVEKATRHPPDLVLLDVMMPAMDGFEVCRRLRSEGALADVPVLLMTALDDSEACQAGLDAGADDFLNKPFDRGLVRARVHTLVRLAQHRRGGARFEWLIDHAADGYLFLTAADRIIYANAQARRILTLPADPIAEPFLTLVRRQFALDPPDAWAVWPPAGADDLARHLQSAEGVAHRVDVLHPPDGGVVVRLVAAFTPEDDPS